MEYKIKLNCRAISFRYNEIDEDLKSKLKSTDEIDVLWMDYLEETSWYCEESQKHWISDRFELTVENLLYFFQKPCYFARSRGEQYICSPFSFEAKFTMFLSVSGYIVRALEHEM